jgi:hypothetical protein
MVRNFMATKSDVEFKRQRKEEKNITWQTYLQGKDDTYCRWVSKTCNGAGLSSDREYEQLARL